jgi:hypothetical protein
MFWRLVGKKETQHIPNEETANTSKEVETLHSAVQEGYRPIDFPGRTPKLQSVTTTRFNSRTVKSTVLSEYGSYAEVEIFVDALEFLQSHPEMGTMRANTRDGSVSPGFTQKLQTMLATSPRYAVTLERASANGTYAKTWDRLLYTVLHAVQQKRRQDDITYSAEAKVGPAPPFRNRGFRLALSARRGPTGSAPSTAR